MFFRFTALVLAVSVTCLGATDRPNIIYILADDLGYGDLGCYGSVLNQTPHIDSLAETGLRLTDFHAASWCAPSRRALMSGCHANRPWKEDGQRWGRFASAILLPEMLKEAGYSTALLGKWHLELDKGLHPLDQGFDYWYGTKGSNDWDGPRPNYQSFRQAPESAWKTPLYINRERKGPIVPQSLFTKRYTEEAVRLIKENKETEAPFFLYLAHNMPHVPVFASETFRGKSEGGVYGDVIAEIDWSVGEILKALKENDLLGNTLVVFTSDNGPWSMFTEFSGIADPLRGEKSTTWEGGDRVPFVVSWPGKIAPRVHAGLIANYDIYVTVASIAGANITKGHAIDSLDMSGVFLRGEPSPRTKHLHFHHEPMAMRSGDYKLHFLTRERTRDPETGKQEPSMRHEAPLLFNLKNDISESRDIATDHPEIVKRLTEEYYESRERIENWKPF